MGICWQAGWCELAGMWLTGVCCGPQTREQYRKSSFCPETTCRLRSWSSRRLRFSRWASIDLLSTFLSLSLLNTQNVFVLSNHLFSAHSSVHIYLLTYSQCVLFSVKVPTPITTMKISSKRVSKSVQMIFLISAHIKRKETIFRRKVKATYIRSCASMLHNS